MRSEVQTLHPNAGRGIPMATCKEKVNPEDEVCESPNLHNQGTTKDPVTPAIIAFLNFMLDFFTQPKFSPRDLFEALKSQKGKGYRIPTEVKINNLPLLHACVHNKKSKFMPVIFHMGWWTILSKLKAKITESGDEMTAIEYAESINAQKFITEMKDIQVWEDSLDAIMKAARSGDKSKIETSIKSKSQDLHYRDANNGNALYWAVVYGDADILNILLDKAGLDPSMKTLQGETLLHVAIIWGQSHLVETLVKKCEIKPDIKDISRKTAIERCAEYGDVECIKVFHRCGINIDKSLIVVAAYNGKTALVAHCIEAFKLDLNISDEFNRTSLLRCVEAGHLDLTKYLVEKGADVSIVTSSNRNILHMVAESGDLQIAKFIIEILLVKNLLQHCLQSRDRHVGVECTFLIRGRDKGRDAWHYVKVKRCLVPLFLKKSKAGTIDVSYFGKIIKSGWGSNPDQDNVDAIEDSFKTRRLDRSAPADLTPLHLALFKGHFEIARLLIENGAPIDSRDHEYLTPMMLAAANNSPALVQLLQDKGADSNDVNNEGQTAADMAEINIQNETVNYFKGNDYSVKLDPFKSDSLKKFIENLDDAKLLSLRRQGADVKKHVIEVLREFRVDINQTLMDLGSGPILEAESA